MDRGFAANCQLARTLPASYPVLVHRLASLLHASFRPHLTVRPLRFAITSPPSGCEEDLHLPAVDHARHTIKGGENNFVFTSRGGVGCCMSKPSAAQQACPARQVCGLTRGLLFGNSIGDSPPKSFSFSAL